MYTIEGKRLLKYYKLKKLHKCGYKVFVLSGVSGFSYNFETFIDKSDNISTSHEPEMDASSNVVVLLAKIIPKLCNCKLYIGNWFNSTLLQIFIYESGILLLEMIRSKRL